MNTLYILIVNDLKEYRIDLLDLFTILSILVSILVIINKNPVVSVLFLICLFVLISGYLMILGMKFIGLSYLLVYIGAVSILFLFILMLINIRISEIQTETNNSLPLAIIISVYFYITFYEITPDKLYNNILSYLSENIQSDIDLNNSANQKNIFCEYNLADSRADLELVSYSKKDIELISDTPRFILGDQWETNVTEILHISSIGNILYTNYFVWLILASIILLLAMVGTIIITIKQ